MSDTPKQKPPLEVLALTTRETELAFAIPAPFSNKFFVNLTYATGRIAFGEQGPGGTLHIHSAVCMTRADVQLLVNLLQNLIDKNPVEEVAVQQVVTNRDG